MNEISACNATGGQNAVNCRCANGELHVGYDSLSYKINVLPHLYSVISILNTP